MLCASAYCYGNGRCQARAGVYSFPRGPFAFLESLAAAPATSALAFIAGFKFSQQKASFLCADDDDVRFFKWTRESTEIRGTPAGVTVRRGQVLWSNLRRDRFQFTLLMLRMDQLVRLPGWDEQRDDGGDGDGGKSKQEGRAER